VVSGWLDAARSLEISALRYSQGGSVVDTWLSFPRKINALIAGLRASRECRAAHWGNDTDLSLVVRSKNLDAVQQDGTGIPSS